MADSSRTIKLKLDADAAGIVAATKTAEREVDRMTKSVDKKFRTSGDESGKGFAAGLKKWFSPKALGDLKKSGEFGGTLFGSGLLGAIKTPVLGPAIVATLGAVVATTLPAIGAIAGTGLVAGFGLGLSGLGIAFAAKSNVVKQVWKTDLAEMGGDMQELSTPFESTLVSMAGFAKRTFGRFKPELDASFRLLAPTLTTFGDDVSRALEKLAPAVRPLSEASAAVMQTLGPAFQSLLGQASTGLSKLAASVKENPDALADTVKGVGDLTSSLLGMITTLNNVNGQIKNLTGGTSAVDATFKLLQAGMFVLTGTVDLLGKTVNATQGTYSHFNDNLDKGYDASLLWTQGLSKAQLAAMGITGAVKASAPAVESLTTKYNRQKTSTDALIESMFRLQNLALGLAGAQINYQAAVDGATASIKENGRTLNDNTEKGRANHSALLAVASAANQQTQSMIESNKGLGAATRSATTARSNFSSLAQKMGLSKKEADRLAASLIALPPKKTVNVSAPGAAAAKSNVDELGRSLANLPSKRTIQIVTERRDVKIADPRLPAPRRASGGLTQPKRQYLVGERGPEIAQFDGTGAPRILSAEQTRTELSRAEQPLVVENHIEIGGEVVRVVRTEIKANDRNTKRRVTAGVRS